MPSGSKIKDEEQEYQFSMPFISPSGHEFSFYDTPENQRLVMKHASGSHMEFKADGSVFVKAVKDVHTHSSVLSEESESEKGSDSTTQRVDTDHTLEVAGRLKIKCSELDFEIGSVGRVYAGTDLFVQGNNIVQKATEQVSIEGQKSIYVDTKEMRERVVARQSEAGTMEESSSGGGGGGGSTEGGINVMKVYGNTVIQNDDENGGITIASKGYLNLVCGKERVDLTGKFTEEPSEEAIGTFTNLVFEPEEQGEMDKSKKPGDYIMKTDAGAYYQYGKETKGSSEDEERGLFQEVTKGDMWQEIKDGKRERKVEKDEILEVKKDRKRKVEGDEKVEISGTQTIKAKKIFLN